MNHTVNPRTRQALAEARGPQVEPMRRPTYAAPRVPVQPDRRQVRIERRPLAEAAP